MKDYSMLTPDALAEEAKRIQRKEKRNTTAMVVWGFMLIVPIFLLLDEKISRELFVAVYTAIIALCILSLKHDFKKSDKLEEQKEEYAAAYKSMVVNMAAGELFDYYTYDMDRGYEEDVVLINDVLPFSYYAKSADLLCGTYKGVEFRRADIEASAASTHKNLYSTDTVFLGQWMDFPWPERFSSVLYIYTRGLFNEIDEQTVLYSGIDSRGARFLTNDTEFDKRFRCLSTDREEAASLLTPRVREGIRRISVSLGKPFAAGFANGRFFFMVHTKEDHLEPPLYIGNSDTLNLDYETDKALKTLGVVCDVIDRIGLVEEDAGRDSFAKYGKEEQTDGLLQT